MSDARIVPWPLRPASVDFEQLAELWNQSADGRHAFFPWNAQTLARQLDPANGWNPDGLILALDENNRPAGAVQATAIDVDSGYDPAGAIELLLARPDQRRRGLATALARAAEEYLRGQKSTAVEAMGPWPYGPHFAALADGSERSGVFRDDAALDAFFRKLGYVDGRESIVLRRVTGSDAALAARRDTARGEAPSFGLVFHREARRAREGWLDHCFRAWTLWDHILAEKNSGYILSRAIYARMDGLSDYSGREHYALFGVFTPPTSRREGWARRNLSAALGHLESLGAATVELHCYADNSPALGLYTALGFEPIARTRAMRKRL